MAYIGNTPAENYASFLTETFTVSATTNYTLSHAVANENDIRLVINGVVQQPGSGKAYTASGTTLTLTSATVSGDVMYAVYLGRALQTVNPPNASVGASQTAPTIITGQTALASEPADTDEFLVSDAGTLKRIDYSLIKGGGITQADVLYYSGSNSFSSGTQNTFSGWTRQSQSGYAKIGDGVTESSGVFTLPATGIYLIQAHWYIYAGSDVTYITTNIYGTQNNGSSWTNIAADDTSIKQVVGQTYLSSQQFAQFDCTNTSTHKIYTSSYGTQNYNVGNSQNGTYISFIRLGDT